MNIWTVVAPGTWPPDKEGYQFGCFCTTSSEGEAAAGARVMLQVTDVADLPAGGSQEVHAFVPAGYGGHIFLLEKLAATGRTLCVAINGIGGRGLAEVRRVLHGAPYALCFDSRDVTDFDFLQQLVWLQAQPEPFAVLTTTPQRTEIAAATDPDHLIAASPEAADLDRLLKLLSLRAQVAVRPISQREVDGISEREVSLTVCRAMRSGEILWEADLTAQRMRSKGLAPALLPGVVGRMLRYDIAPGEPLTFGHLVEAK